MATFLITAGVTLLVIMYLTFYQVHVKSASDHY
jgi:hypothetical protein